MRTDGSPNACIAAATNEHKNPAAYSNAESGEPR